MARLFADTSAQAVSAAKCSVEAVESVSCTVLGPGRFHEALAPY